jgi:hypothetical protein
LESHFDTLWNKHLEPVGYATPFPHKFQVSTV